MLTSNNDKNQTNGLRTTLLPNSTTHLYPFVFNQAPLVKITKTVTTRKKTWDVTFTLYVAFIQDIINKCKLKGSALDRLRCHNFRNPHVLLLLGTQGPMKKTYRLNKEKL